MKRFNYIFIFLIFSDCTRAPLDIPIETKQDSTFYFKQALIKSIKREFVLMKQLGVSDSIISVLKYQMNFVLNDVNKYQSSEMRAIKANNDLIDLQKYNEHYIDSIELLKAQLQNANQLYIVANARIVEEKKETDNLKNKLSYPKIALVTVKCYGFKKATEFETYIASKIKRIVIQFDIPTNDVVDKKTYSINFKIGTILKKSMIIKMTGEEMRDESITFDVIDLLKAGEYPVTIDVSGKLEYSSNLILK